MSETNQNHITSIDVTEVDWNKLSPEEFHKLEKEMQAKHVEIRKANRKKTRDTGTKTIMYKEKMYEIKAVLYNRLKKIKSEKSREKLLEEIIASTNPIEEL